MPSSSTRPKKSRTSSSRNSTASRSSRAQAPEKTEILINVYDLLPPGRLSSILWTLGGSLLHSGVVIRGKEYAYGGHNRRDITGVYWTKPRFEPPGGTWRCDILQGFTFRSEQEIEVIVKEVSDHFLGEKYNLLTCNCNHFTSALCERLTSRSAPGWLNRAASVGVALPCVVPREWIAPPDVDTADGELLEEEEEESGHEDAPMLGSERRKRQREARRRGNVDDGSSIVSARRIFAEEGTPPPRLVKMKDTDGRQMPVAERAPLPKRI